MSYSKREAVEQRRRNWRIILGTIIVITIPFYCVGVFLWGTAPQRNATPTPTVTILAPPVTQGPIIVTATSQGVPTITPLALTVFPTIPTSIFPTFVFPTAIPTVILSTRVLSPTPTVAIPTQPPPPTSPPQPTQAPPPTQSPITQTPIPFDTLPP